MDILTRESLRKAGNLLLSVSGGRSDRDRPKLNLWRLISDLSKGRANGEDREAIDEYARVAGINPDPQRPFIPFTELRDLKAGLASGGGYLVSAETQEARDILRPWSVTARAGMQIEVGLQGDQVVPITSGKTTPYWLSTEASEVTPTDPTLKDIPMTPKTVGGIITFSRQLAKQANADLFVRRELLRTVGTGIDQAVLSGSGAAGEPIGLLNVPGIGTQAGTSIDYAKVTALKGDVAAANAPDEAIAYLSTPAVRELLEIRERATGSGFIWDDDKVASRPAFVSTDVPAATMICGAWEAAYLGIWGAGFVLEINPFDPALFKKGMIQARVLVSCDVAFLHPVAFSVATSIT